MLQVSNEELSKIAQFSASVDDMINGKFLLADVKITKVLNMIAESQELYRYISECMAGFDFSKEFHRAEVKNSLNGGSFNPPSDPEKLVAFVFCLLVECDSKRRDFYTFIGENFAGETRADSYKNFSNVLLVPFKETITARFGLGGASAKEIEDLTNNYREDLKEAPVFEEQNNRTIFDEEMSGLENWKEHNEHDVNAGQKSSRYEELSKSDDWSDIVEICTNVESAVYAERHLKEYLKEELLYIIKIINIYCGIFLIKNIL